MKLILIFEVFKKAGKNNYVLSYAWNVCKLHVYWIFIIFPKSLKNQFFVKTLE